MTIITIEIIKQKRKTYKNNNNSNNKREGTSPQMKQKAKGFGESKSTPSLPYAWFLFFNLYLYFFPAKVANSYRNRYLELGQRERHLLALFLSRSYLPPPSFKENIERYRKRKRKRKEKEERKKSIK